MPTKTFDFDILLIRWY